MLFDPTFLTVYDVWTICVKQTLASSHGSKTLLQNQTRLEINNG